MGTEDGDTAPDPTGTQGRARITWRPAPAFTPEDAPSHLTGIGTANDRTTIKRNKAIPRKAVVAPVHPPARLDLPALPGPVSTGQMPLAWQDVTVRVNGLALATVDDDIRTELERERGGFLVGKVYRNPTTGGTIVDIQAAIPAIGAIGGPGFWELTPQAWDHVSRELEVRHPDRIIVGWYHSHPGMGPFFSSVDRRMQRGHFPNQWNVALVGDPVERFAPMPDTIGWHPHVPRPRVAARPGETDFRWYVGPDAREYWTPLTYWNPVPCVMQTGPAPSVRAPILVGATVRIGHKNGRRITRIIPGRDKAATVRQYTFPLTDR